MKYVKLPLNFLRTVRGERNGLCSLEESIAQSIMMQTTCRFGEVEGRLDYGSAIWDLEFNQLVRVHEWEEQVRNSLIHTIEKYEKRLKNVIVDVNLTEVQTESKTKGRSLIRKQADIYVKGTVIYSDAPFHFNTTIYISPLSQ